MQCSALALPFLFSFPPLSQVTFPITWVTFFPILNNAPSFHPNAANAPKVRGRESSQHLDPKTNHFVTNDNGELAMPSQGSPEIPSPIRARSVVRAPLQGSGPSRSNPACRNTRRSFPAIRSRCVHSVHGQSRHDSPSHSGTRPVPPSHPAQLRNGCPPSYHQGDKFDGHPSIPPRKISLSLVHHLCGACFNRPRVSHHPLHAQDPITSPQILVPSPTLAGPGSSLVLGKKTV